MEKGDEISAENAFLQAKYDWTALFYDILDYPWERIYRNWRPALLMTGLPRPRTRRIVTYQRTVNETRVGPPDLGIAEPQLYRAWAR